MKVGSLFAGIGGFDLGLERAGMETAWQVELNPYRRAVLARHFPEAERFENVEEVGAQNLRPVELICGGFPCQDLSLAGRGAGIEGARSGLWGEFARIVGDLRPRYVIVENVPALLTRGIWRVLGDLAALGYDAEWDCLPASAFGAPHRRDRIWLVAYPDGGEERDEPGRFRRPDGAGAPEPGDDGGEGSLAHSNGAGLEERQGLGGDPRAQQAPPERDGVPGGAPQLADAEVQSEWSGLRPGGPAGIWRGRPGDGNGTRDPWATEPDVGRVADGVPARVDRLSALGDSLLPQIAEWIGRRILEHEQRTGE